MAEQLCRGARIFSAQVWISGSHSRWLNELRIGYTVLLSPPNAHFNPRAPPPTASGKQTTQTTTRRANVRWSSLIVWPSCLMPCMPSLVELSSDIRWPKEELPIDGRWIGSSSVRFARSWDAVESRRTELVHIGRERSPLDLISIIAAIVDIENLAAF